MRKETLVLCVVYLQIKRVQRKKKPPQLFERESAARVNVTMRIYKQTVIVGIITS